MKRYTQDAWQCKLINACKQFSFLRWMVLLYGVTGKVENLHAHVNRNLQHANPNLHVL